MQSKVHAEKQYREQLKLCKFRSWKQANKRRIALIYAGAGIESEEFQQLQKLADLYISWKTNDYMSWKTND